MRYRSSKNYFSVSAVIVFKFHRDFPETESYFLVSNSLLAWSVNFGSKV